ncbi:MAG: heavy-metal-associated domain-containing protein [Campylobacterales bacterium]|nr:heavy-metal-associated domain-containing protein [Campylobacterales bacterium]HEO98997.1 copper chaperone [Campylobacterota bacterium]
MKQTFEVLNIKCGGCASTIKTKLFDAFGEIEVDLSKNPREITVDITEERVPELKTALKKLGYPMKSEQIGFVEANTAKAKSIISCAIGKMNQ